MSDAAPQPPAQHSSSQGFGSATVTNALLLVIAVLLLVGVMQLRAPRGRKAPGGMASVERFEGSAPPPPVHSAPFAPGARQAPASAPAFDASQMVLAAMVCPADPTLILGDMACAGPKADERRAFVDKVMAQGLRVSAVFDEIVGAFGDAALTQEARDIRAQARAQRGQK